MRASNDYGRSWRARMSHEVVGSAARMLILTCAAVGVLSSLFDHSVIREIRLLACGIVAAAAFVAVYLLRKRQFGFAVFTLLISLYLASAAGSIGTQTGLRAPSLMVLSMFSLICAFAFPRKLAMGCIGLNVVYLCILFGLEKAGVIDPSAHLEALNSTSVFIVLVTLSVIFGVLGFPLGEQVDKAMQRMQRSRSNLGRSRELYRSLVEGAPIGIVNFDVLGSITSVNPTLAHWLGHPAESFRGQSVELLLQRPVPPGFRLPGAQPLRFDVSLSGGHPDDPVRWMSVTLSAFPHGKGSYRGGVALMLDETERKRSELELIRAKEAAEAAVVAKTRFLSHMSHELRTPMAGILGSIGLAQDDRVSPDKRRRMLTLLEGSARTMLGLLDDILDAARLAEGPVELDRDIVSPHQLVMQTHELFRPAAEARDLHLRLHWQGDSTMQCIGDPMRIRQVIGILVDNAVRFTDFGQVRITAVAQVESPGICRFRVSVSDTGIGLSAEQQVQMFKPFTELGLKRPENQRGAGLGLSIAKGLVESMGGRIGLQSEPQRGSDFWFELHLPLVNSPQTTESDVKSPEIVN